MADYCDELQYTNTGYDLNYEQAVAYIDSVPKFTKKNKPSNTWEMVERLGHPERDMKVIHVAGTNGKGSVCAFMSSILVHAGKRTGLFTSPHLVEMTERFQINQQNVDKTLFAEAFNEVKKVVDAMMRDGYAHPAYFELLFGMGLYIFHKEKVEYLVMETGLGGRMDATNVVEKPIVTVLTTMSLDHMEYLGDTVAQIAWEKAGIIKEGIPVVFDGRNPESESVIQTMAKEKHAQTYKYDSSMCRILCKSDKNIEFLWNNRYDKKESFAVTVPFPAEYQLVNSSLAMMAIRAIDPQYEISNETIAQGIAQAKWQGRMESVMQDVILDGAHNADGVHQFIQTVKSIQTRRRVSLLFSAVVEKEYEKMIKELCTETHFTSIVVTQIEGSRIVPAETLAEVFRKYTDVPVMAVADVGKAFDTACEKKGDGILFCAGSLYLVGEIKAYINKCQ